MALIYLDHVNLRTSNLAAMTRFYCSVLGLRLGARPPFTFGGAWLYCGERPVVHLVEVSSPPKPGGALGLEHFAFAANDFDELLSHLSAAGVEYRVSKLTGSETRQVNLRDPDGNRIHIDFSDHLAK
jgi:catechol 2,3-dioxygenase-like lactoylglutathione lyase family enzyme